MVSRRNIQSLTDVRMMLKVIFSNILTFIRIYNMYPKPIFYKTFHSLSVAFTESKKAICICSLHDYPLLFNNNFKLRIWSRFNLVENAEADFSSIKTGFHIVYNLRKCKQLKIFILLPIIIISKLLASLVLITAIKLPSLNS